MKRLRTQGAGYRTRAREVAAERDDWKGKYETLVRQNEERDRTAVSERRVGIAKRHGLWDDTANDGKGGLLPGIDLGSGSEDEMNKVAEAIVSRFRGSATGGTARRPVTVAGTTSGTSDRPPSGTGRAASALREMMRNRNTGAG